jgi:hypothetical protein
VWCNRLVIVTANAHTCLAVQPHSYVGQVLQAMLDGDDSPAAFLNPQVGPHQSTTGLKEEAS